jgi:hypothetical protein
MVYATFMSKAFYVFTLQVCCYRKVRLQLSKFISLFCVLCLFVIFSFSICSFFSCMSVFSLFHFSLSLYSFIAVIFFAFTAEQFSCRLHILSRGLRLVTPTVCDTAQCSELKPTPWIIGFRFPLVDIPFWHSTFKGHDHFLSNFHLLNIHDFLSISFEAV